MKTPRYSEKNNPEYVKRALRTMRDFGIVITFEVRASIEGCPTEEAVDRLKRKLIYEHLGNH